MPSHEEHVRRVQSLEHRLKRAQDAYDYEAQRVDRLIQQLNGLIANLDQEEELKIRNQQRFGPNTTARANIRAQLRADIDQCRRQVADCETRLDRRFGRSLRTAKKDLKEELRYWDEIHTLQRRPIPREIAEMIAHYNYNGRWSNLDPDA